MKAPLILFASVLAGTGHAQLLINSAPPASEIADLLEGVGVTITDVELNCSGTAMGHFTGTSDVPIEEGLLLTTGSVMMAAGQASDFASEALFTGGDPDLTAIAGSAIYDACILSFTCIPMGDTLMFNYVFASEEYPEFVCMVNDAFGLFLSGPGISGPYGDNAANVALLPGTLLPVSINTVNDGQNIDPNNPSCTGANASYYIDNASGTTVVYDGFTEKLTATAVVVPGETYRFKLAVGDALDRSFDSAVFLEAFSFRSSAGTTAVGHVQALQATLLREADAITVIFPPGTQVQELRLLNATGQELSRHRPEAERVRLHTAALPTGIYIVQALGPQQMVPLRFVLD